MVDEKKITYRNNPKPTEKLVGPHNEKRLPSKDYNQGKNGREKEKTENDVTELDDERQVDSKLKERAGHRGEWHHWT